MYRLSDRGLGWACCESIVKSIIYIYVQIMINKDFFMYIITMYIERVYIYAVVRLT